MHKKASKSEQVVKINFDATYEARTCQSVTIVVARNSEGGVLLSCSVIQQRVVSALATQALACRVATQIGIDIQW